MSKTNGELARELADTQLLQELSTQLIHQDCVEGLYEKIMDAAVVVMRSDFATLQCLHPERGLGGQLRLLAYRGFPAEVTREFEWVPIDTPTTCCAALRNGQRVIVPDFEQCEFMAGTDALQMHLRIGIHAAQSTPLISRTGKMVGMITTQRAYEMNSKVISTADQMLSFVTQNL